MTIRPSGWPSASTSKKTRGSDIFFFEEKHFDGTWLQSEVGLESEARTFNTCDGRSEWEWESQVAKGEREEDNPLRYSPVKIALIFPSRRTRALADDWVNVDNGFSAKLPRNLG